MRYACEFSPDATHRFTLVDRWDELLNPDFGIAWIGLNPSTADAFALDNTLTKIETFSKMWGYSFFVMLNLFSFRATDPKDMKKQAVPNLADNDRWIMHWVEKVDRVLVCWGDHGTFQNRATAVLAMLPPEKVWCLTVNQSGAPMHPLYVPYTTQPMRYPPPAGTKLTMPGGWQRHPSTQTAHFFPIGQVQSACKREHRTTAPVSDEPGVYPCTFCQNALSNTVRFPLQ